MDKSQLRSHMIARRKMMDAREIKEKSAAIADSLRSIVNLKRVTSIHSYHSNPGAGEVDTSWMAAWLKEQAAATVLTYGPTIRTAPVPDETYDVIIVPLLAFDERLHRIGYGGGWYDRFLSKQPLAMLIGLGYDFQKVHELPIEEHDIALDMIITESGILRK